MFPGMLRIFEKYEEAMAGVLKTANRKGPMLLPQMQSEFEKAILILLEGLSNSAYYKFSPGAREAKRSASLP